MAGLGVLCIVYGYLIEPYWPEVTHVNLPAPKLHRAMRLVHLSDLHCDAKPRLEEKLPALIAAQHPDAIVFTGDSVNSLAGVPVFRRLLTELVAVAPTFVVKGNWDSWYWADKTELFQGTGAQELDGQVAKLGELTIGGVAVGHEERIPKMLEQMQGFSVFLFHYPDEIYTVAGKVDLHLAGHTHGGQVALPLYGALITMSRFGKRFESGLFEVAGTRLYVNRGIGMEGGSAPRVRFWARPEITVIDLAP